MCDDDPGWKRGKLGSFQGRDLGLFLGLAPQKPDLEPKPGRFSSFGLTRQGQERVQTPQARDEWDGTAPGTLYPHLAASWGLSHPVSPTPPPRCPLADPPRAVSVRTFLENQEGRGAIVLCTAQSHPPSRLSLHHRGRLLATSLSPAVTSGLRAVPSHNALRLELVALGTAAEGRYVCVATNALGNATGSADLDVHSEWGRTLQRIVGIPQKIFPRKWEMEQEGAS